MEIVAESSQGLTILGAREGLTLKDILITECTGPQYQHPLVRTVIVDDSQFTLTRLCSLLQYCVRLAVVATAENGEQAVELVRVHRPELVLMDLQMPGMNGFEAASRIVEEFPTIRVVHITTHAGPEIEQASRDSGAQFLLPKAQFVSRFCVVFQQLFNECDRAPVPETQA